MMLSRKSRPSSQPNVHPQNQVGHFTALGTHWQIVLPELTAKEQREVIKVLRLKLEEYEQVYSRFRPDSLVGQMARQAGTYRFPNTITPLWQLYEQLALLTNNRFTPFIGSLISSAGYDPEYSLQTKSLKAPPDWDSIQVSYPNMTASQPVELDFGAAGKGYAVDLLIAELASLSIHAAYINAGGDIRHCTPKREDHITVGLEHPYNDQQVIGTVTLHNQSLCGSAGNRRAWGSFHHIIDPHTLASPKHIASAWVIADSTLLADALATCLFLVEPTQLQKHFNFDYIRVFADQSVEYSPSTQIELF